MEASLCPGYVRAIRKLATSPAVIDNGLTQRQGEAVATFSMVFAPSGIGSEGCEYACPSMFVAEAVLICLDSLSPRCALSGVATRFPSTTLTLGAIVAAMVDSQAPHAAARHLPPDSRFRCRCDNPSEMEPKGANPRLLPSESFFNAACDLQDCTPIDLRLTWRFPPSR